MYYCNVRNSTGANTSLTPAAPQTYIYHYPNGLSPRITLRSTEITAMTNNRWTILPPISKAKPNTHKITKTTAIVYNMIVVIRDKSGHIKRLPFYTMMSSEKHSIKHNEKS